MEVVRCKPVALAGDHSWRGIRSMKYALLVLMVLLELVWFACGGGASSDTRRNPPGSPRSSLTATPSSGLPPCQTATATNCDASNLKLSAGTHASPACSGKGTAMIGASPIDLSEIAYIQPMGLMIGGHVTQIDHGYFYIKGTFETPPRQAAVRSPLGGVITSVTRTARHG